MNLTHIYHSKSTTKIIPIKRLLYSIKKEIQVILVYKIDEKQ